MFILGAKIGDFTKNVYLNYERGCRLTAPLFRYKVLHKSDGQSPWCYADLLIGCRYDARLEMNRGPSPAASGLEQADAVPAMAVGSGQAP